MFTDLQLNIAKEVVSSCNTLNLRITTAESCTGGLISSCITAIAGSSNIFDRGFVTYTNQAKIDLLGVSPDLFELCGAVSEEVAYVMAEGALERSIAQISVAVTGIAGPSGGTVEKPVGLVHIASASEGFKIFHERHIFKGGREEVRMSTVIASLKLILKQINQIKALNVI